ncbi:glycosyltransferase family 39 protein (plasmid) [Roseobacteraceae bacterium NS-SX3]
MTQGGAREVWGLAAILALALALRLAGLDAPLWFDEIVTVETHLSQSWGGMLQDYSMNHHYLFSLQAKLSALAFGDENWAYRLPALLFGVATVAAVWVLARDVSGPGVAHLAALLTALSYHQVWFSQNARGYTGLAFWCTLGLILFLRGSRRPAPGVWLAFGAVLAAAVFTHLTGAFFFAALGLVWLGHVAAQAVRGSLARGALAWPLLGALAGGLLLAALYAPMLPSLLETVGGVSGTSAADLMQEYQNPLWTVIEGMRTATGASGPLATVLAGAALALAVLGALATRSSAPLFAPAVAAHVVLTLALLLALGMRVWPRFFFADLGLVMILLAAGAQSLAMLLARLAGRPHLGRAGFLALAAAMVALSALMVQRNYRAPKQDLAGAYELAEALRRPGERIYAVGYSGPLFRSHFGAGWGMLQKPEDYEKAMAEPGPVTVVVPFPDRSFRQIPAMDRDLEAGSLYLERLLPGTLGDGNVLVFRRD